jgi:hypothetical protein
MARYRAKRTASSTGGIGIMVKIVLVVIGVVIVGGVAFLATWDMPAPKVMTEKVIPNDRFK